MQYPHPVQRRYTHEELALIEAQRRANDQWHWEGSKGSYILCRVPYTRQAIEPKFLSAQYQLTAGALYRTQVSMGGGMYKKVWGVRKAKDPRKYIGWDYDTFFMLTTIDWMPYKEAQDTAKILLLAGMETI